MKNRLRDSLTPITIVATLAAVAILVYRKVRSALRKISQFSTREGSSEARYDGYERLYLAAGRSGTATADNDGILTRVATNSSTLSDRYILDYAPTDGENPRWGDVLTGNHYSNVRENNEKALTYTSRPLESDVEVTGNPIVHLWLVTDAPDLDVFVYLEEVDPQGNVASITRGNLRASHRADLLRQPYYDHYESNLQAIRPGEPFELVFDLLATSHLFPADSQIRITVTFAGADDFDTSLRNPVSGLNLLRSRHYPSRMELPCRVT